MDQLDTVYLVETPEGIDLQAQLAGPVVRAIAYIIDVVIKTVVMSVVWLVLMFAGNVGTGIMLLLSFLLEWFYPVLFEVYNNGQTIGKKQMGLTVVNGDLTPINWGASLTRNLLRFVDFLPFSYLGGLMSMTLTKKFQRLGDLAVGSLVIYKPEIRKQAVLPECLPRPPSIPLALDDQIAIIGFTERHNDLSYDRQKELAHILSDVTELDAEKNIQYLRGVGSWLLGVR